MPSPSSLLSPFTDFSALHSSETQNFPPKVMCLATSIILAVGKRTEYSTKEMEGNDSQHSASLTEERNTGPLPGPSHPGEMGVFKVPTPSPGPSVYISSSAGFQSHTNSPKRVLCFPLNSHNSLQKQVCAKHSCSGLWPRVSEYCSPHAELRRA